MFRKLKIIKPVTAVFLTALIFSGLAALASPAAAQTDEAVLTSADIESLLYMREEEKLARDVYLTFYDLWGVPLFNNIAASEQTHADTVLNLLTLYGLPDPADGNGVGVFSNPTLQALYNELVSQGSLSYAEALRVGGLIEEVDIADLQSELDTTQVAAIQQVYASLKAASSNHLRAFATRYQSVTGEPYLPQRLGPEAVAAILGSSETGPQGNANGFQGRGQNGQGNGNQFGSGGAGSGQGNTGSPNAQGSNINQGSGAANGRISRNGGGNATFQNNLQ